jgi:hypothetical protein
MLGAFFCNSQLGGGLAPPPPIQQVDDVFKSRFFLVMK